jgi:hypothetical protein
MAATTAFALLAATLINLVHELGHVLGGWLAGYRFVFLVWGPLQVSRDSSRWRLSWNRSLFLAGGVALCVPTSTASRSIRGRVVFVAGGPLISLLSGIIALVAAFGFGVSGTTLQPGALVMAVFGLLSVGIAAGTLVPTQVGGLMSDGMQLVRALQCGEAAAIDSAVAALMGLALGPDRPCHWPSDLVAEVENREDVAKGSAVQWLLYIHALDQGNAPVARDRLQQALLKEASWGPVADTLALEAAFLEIAARRDPERCRYWLARAGSSADPTLRRVVHAVSAALSGDSDSSKTALAEVAELSKRAGMHAAHADWVRRLVASPADMDATPPRVNLSA